MTSVDVDRRAVTLIKNSFLAPTPIRAQLCPMLLLEIDGPTRRPLLELTLMRCLLSGITAALKGADAGGAECAPVESALVLNFTSNEKTKQDLLLRLLMWGGREGEGDKLGVGGRGGAQGVVVAQNTG